MIVYIALGIAIFFLAARVRGHFSPRSGCGSCGCGKKGVEGGPDIPK